MNSIHHGWSLDEIAPEARRAAERAAEAAGMPLEIWLNQLIKYVSAMELSGKGPARARAIDETIKRAAAEQARIGPIDGPPEESDDTPMMLETEAPAEQPTTLAAEVLEPNRFAEEHPGERDIEQAIGEWRKSGALKPLVVRPDSRNAGHYEIVSGMERWHAASRLHMRRIPVTVQQLSDEEVLRATLIQKLHTKSLPPLDEAEIYQRLMEETGLSVAALSDVIGRSPTHVATALQLLDLPEPVREMINSGELSVLHARTLLGAADPEPAAREVVARRLDIYQTEQLVRASHGALTPPAAKTAAPAEPAEPKKAAADAPADANGRDADDALAGETPQAEFVESVIAEPEIAEPERAGPEIAEPERGAISFSGPLPTEAQTSSTEAPSPTAAQTQAGNGPAPGAAPLTDHPTLPDATPNDPASAEPAASEPPRDETGTSEAPLDMAEYITADMGARESTPDTADKTSPIVLGGIDGDAGTLIEASPAIDNPGPGGSLDESPAYGSTAGDTVTPQPPAEPAVAEENEPEPASGALDAASAAPKETEAGPAPDALEIPAAAAAPAEGMSGEAGPGGNADGRDGDGEVNIEETKESPVPAESTGGATITRGNSGGQADSEDRSNQDDRDDQERMQSDDSTRMVETHLTTLLGLKVSIAERNQDDGVLSIHYNSESELTDLVSRLNRMPTGRRAE